MSEQLIDKLGLAVAKEHIASFRKVLRGEVILPEEPLYETARRIWNASVNQNIKPTI